MKRKFTVIGFSFVFSLLLTNYIFGEYSWILAFVVAFSIILTRMIRSSDIRHEINLSLLSVLSAVLVYMIFFYFSYKPAVKYTNVKSEIHGTVISECTQGESGTYRCLVRVSDINGEKCSFKVILYTPGDIAALPGYKVKYTCYPFITGGNEKRSQKYYLSKNIFSGTYTKYEVSIENDREAENSLYYRFLREKINSEKILRSFLYGDYAEFANSILFGDKAYLSDDVYSSFKQAGFSHIMAVSGLHMSIWVYGLYLILRRLSLSDRLSGAVCILFAFSVMLFSSFSVSVVRAFIMTSVYFSGIFFRRRSDALNSLGLAALIICIINPFSVCDPSFLLSLFATAGITVYADNMPRFLTRKVNDGFFVRNAKNLGNTVFLSLAAGAFSVTVSANYFGHISLYSWLSNLLCGIAVTPCLIISGVLTMFPTLDTVYIRLSRLLMFSEKYIFFICGSVSALPFSYPEAGIIIGKIIPLLAIILIVFIRYRRKRQFDTVPALIGLCIGAAAVLI